MERDRFGNVFAPGLPYARGNILKSTEDDFRKLQRAWRIIERSVRKAGPQSIFNFSGLEHGLPMEPEDLVFADDELAPPLYLERLKALALEHFGGSPERHDVMLFNRLTAATLATHLVLVNSGELVVGVSPSFSHPSVVRAVEMAGGKFLDTAGVDAFAATLERESRVALVVLTRLPVSYDMFPLNAVRAVIRLAHEKGALVYVDDAGGARVGPAVFSQPRMLELGVDVGATGLDKYGTLGPRLGLLAGEKEVVGRIRARAFELGLEARPLLYPAVVRSLERYTPERVRALVDATKQVASALRSVLGGRIYETPVAANLLAEDILGCAMERARLAEPPIVPYEATAALAMLLLQDYGILSVHMIGLPPGNSSLLIKFVSPEVLARFGGAAAFARAIDASLTKLGGLLPESGAISELLLGDNDS